MGARVERWTPEETAAGWWFDPARLAELAKDGAKAILVNFPHNPTGALPSSAEWADIVATAERAGALLVSDEMYRGLEYDAGRRLVPAATASERAVSIAGLSKAYGLPGLRVGWLATREKAVLEAVQAYKDYTTICASAPSERLAVVALKNAERLVGRCRAIVATNRPLLEAFLARHAQRFSWRPPLAGPIAFARLHSGDASAFCEHLALAGRRHAPAEQRLRVGRRPRPLRLRPHQLPGSPRGSRGATSDLAEGVRGGRRSSPARA